MELHGKPRLREGGWPGLLANEKAVAPLIRFLKATEVGAREGGRESEAEWERKNDRAGENLLG